MAKTEELIALAGARPMRPSRPLTSPYYAADAGRERADAYSRLFSSRLPDNAFEQGDLYKEDWPD
jgi:hypothetical protein